MDTSVDFWFSFDLFSFSLIFCVQCSFTEFWMPFTFHTRTFTPVLVPFFNQTEEGGKRGKKKRAIICQYIIFRLLPKKKFHFTARVMLLLMLFCTFISMMWFPCSSIIIHAESECAMQTLWLCAIDPFSFNNSFHCNVKNVKNTQKINIYWWKGKVKRHTVWTVAVANVGLSVFLRLILLFFLWRLFSANIFICDKNYFRSSKKLKTQKFRE